VNKPEGVVSGVSGLTGLEATGAFVAGVSNAVRLPEPRVSRAEETPESGASMARCPTMGVCSSGPA